MREIKFRVWHKSSKSFYDLSENNDPFSWLGSPECQQFTGLNDKNGRPIYEGDIIRCSKKEYYREVVFSNGGYWLINPDRLMDFEIQVVNSSHLESEIVGNIFENPELLNPADSKPSI